jgi:hypothetical protein
MRFLAGRRTLMMLAQRPARIDIIIPLDAHLKVRCNWRQAKATHALLILSSTRRPALCVKDRINQVHKPAMSCVKQSV